jgi:thiaminase
MESEELLGRFAHLYGTFQNQQFFVAVANGTITPHQVGTYLVQDAHYVLALRDRLLDLARLVEDAGAQSILLQHSRDAGALPDVTRTIVARELGLPELVREGPRPPTCAYIDHQRRSVCSGVREGILSVLPCYLFYPFLVTAIRSKAPESETLQKCLRCVSTEEQAHRWADEIVEVWDRIGLAEPSAEPEAAFALSAQYEAALLEMAMK